MSLENKKLLGLGILAFILFTSFTTGSLFYVMIAFMVFLIGGFLIMIIEEKPKEIQLTLNNKNKKRAKNGKNI